MKYTGIIVVLLGALALIVPALTNAESNTTLLIGAILLVVGAILHGFIYKIGIDKDIKK